MINLAKIKNLLKNFFVEILDSFVDSETKKIKKRITFSILLGLLGFGVIIWFLIRLLYFEGYWNTSNNINLLQSSLIGEFISGFSGTIFTIIGVVLLFETLVLQRKELKESRAVFEKQQFENTFFNLLKLYEEITKSLFYIDTSSTDSTKFFGKEYFQKNKEKFYNSFKQLKTLSNIRRNVKLAYTDFYSSNKEIISHYFRTIYRTFKYISESSLPLAEKMKYAKIVRAQLSDSELFFIYYNSFSEEGANFRKLILEFNILKHLSQLDKVEFKKYSSFFNSVEKSAIEIFLNEIKKFIKEALLKKIKIDKSYLQGSISVSISVEKSDILCFTIIKNDNIKKSEGFQKGMGIDNLDQQNLEYFFYDFLFDFLYYSNYYSINKKPKIDQKVSKVLGKTIFEFKIGKSSELVIKS